MSGLFWVLCLVTLPGCFGKAEKDLALSASPAPREKEGSPDALAPFCLDGKSFLRGFQKVPSTREVFAPSRREHPGSTAAFNLSYYQGPTELRYSVLLFPTRKALEAWDRREESSNPSWMVTRRPGAADRVILAALRCDSTGRRALAWQATSAVNRMIIIVYGFHHEEMVRRNPKLARVALSDQELARRVRSIAEELVARARSLPANRG